jgi:hypothetical protein
MDLSSLHDSTALTHSFLGMNHEMDEGMNGGIDIGNKESNPTLVFPLS